MKLIKTEVNYLLEDDKGVIIASTSTKENNNKLSKQNCDEIFGVIDVEKLAEESWGDKISSPYHAYIEGFKKSMELYQPTEIEVVIEMELEIDTSKLIGAIYGHKPKLDSEGCLILKKI